MLIVTVDPDLPPSAADVVSWMGSWIDNYAIPGVAVAGFRPTPGPTTAFAVLTPEAAAVIEVAGVRPEIAGGVITVESPEPWRHDHFDGDPLGADGVDPTHQVREGLAALEPLIERHNPGQGTASGVVLLVPPRGSTVRLDVVTAPPGCDVVIGHDGLRLWLHRATRRREPIWTAERVHALLTDLNLGAQVTVAQLLDQGFAAEADSGARPPSDPAALLVAGVGAPSPGGAFAAGGGAPPPGAGVPPPPGPGAPPTAGPGIPPPPGPGGAPGYGSGVPGTGAPEFVPAAGTAGPGSVSGSANPPGPGGGPGDAQDSGGAQRVGDVRSSGDMPGRGGAPGSGDAADPGGASGPGGVTGSGGVTNPGGAPAPGTAPGTAPGSPAPREQGVPGEAPAVVPVSYSGTGGSAGEAGAQQGSAESGSAAASGQGDAAASGQPGGPVPAGTRLSGAGAPPLPAASGAQPPPGPGAPPPPGAAGAPPPATSDPGADRPVAAPGTVPNPAAAPDRLRPVPPPRGNAPRTVPPPVSQDSAEAHVAPGELPGAEPDRPSRFPRIALLVAAAVVLVVVAVIGFGVWTLLGRGDGDIPDPPGDQVIETSLTQEPSPAPQPEPQPAQEPAPPPQPEPAPAPRPEPPPPPATTAPRGCFPFQTNC